MFKRGCIRKVQVRNFVTYSYVEMYPGPNLNMVIGPNGTGKSTIVAAIILGLGGNPKVVGRGTRVSEYVKHNETEATINIFLQGDQENDFVKITRKFTNQDKTSWAINNQTVTLKDVMSRVKEYNIQVDNLCQFLPQDRVQDFAKMNKQDLLKATQLALCREDLTEKQRLLTEHRENHKKLSGLIEKNNEKLGEAQDANVRLEGKVENFNRKKEYLNQIQDIDRKIAWTQYEGLHSKMMETKEDLKKATAVHETYKDAAKPMEQQIREAKKAITDLQNQNSNVIRSSRESEAAMKSNLDTFDQQKRKIVRITSDMEGKLAEIEQRQSEIDLTSSRIAEMKKAQTELISQCGNDAEVKQKVMRISAEMQRYSTHMSNLQDKREEIIHSKQNQGAQIRAYQNEIARLENVKQQRLNHLHRIDEHAYNAVLWLRNNKHLFQGEVFEPIMLELNVLDPRNSKFVENVIPIRDRVAFTCTLKEDMNRLIRSLREEKNLTINVLHSEDTGHRVANFQPSIPIEQLKRFGIYTYLHSLFTAPDPIMRYLCNTYRVHEIPIGDATTDRFFDQLPKQIRVFFSDKQRYSVNFSKYTGEKSTRQNEIVGDGGLSISLDVLRLENLRTQIAELNNNVSNYEDQIREFDSQIRKINDNHSSLSDELKNIRNIKQQAQTIEGRIQAMQRKIQEISQSNDNVEQIRNQTSRKIQNVVVEMGSLQEELKSNYGAFAKLASKAAVNLLKVENARKSAAYLENKIGETRRLCQEAENTLNQIREVYADVRAQAKGALQKAKGLSKNLTPDDADFDQFRDVHEKLSSDLQVLAEEKIHLTSKIDCLTTADDEEMRVYEERVQMIGNLQEEIEGAHVNLSKMTSKMERLKKDWLQPLNQLIHEINLKFGSAFERMGCAGEVSLHTGDDEKEYSKYGLCIKVTYRDGEPLQELNNVVQSGGERAVATAVFMLSLQELTPVPFRCVDEINQGMDANNERRIFELLVGCTSQANTPQYFLITPKLVPNLTYSRSMMIHIVHNGPFVEPDRKWSASMLCNPQGVQIH